MDKTAIEKCIQDGLMKGYGEQIQLVSSYTELVEEVREYLLTVNVAQQLLRWNNNHNYKIQIEYSILHFYQNAFPASSTKWNDIFDSETTARLSGHSPTNTLNQKIDIAIIQDRNADNASSCERTVMGIELKAINKNEANIKRDAERLARAMLKKDPTDENSIKYCFCGFVMRLDENTQIVKTNDIQKLRTEKDLHWNTICNDFNTQFHDLHFTFSMFDIRNTPLEAIEEFHKKIGSDYSEVAAETGIVVGGIITIKRNANTLTNSQI